MMPDAKLNHSLSLRAVGSNADHRKPHFTRLWRCSGEVDDLDHQSGLRGLT